MEVDYTSQVDEALPKADAIAKVFTSLYFLLLTSHPFFCFNFLRLKLELMAGLFTLIAGISQWVIDEVTDIYLQLH